MLAATVVPESELDLGKTGPVNASLLHPQPYDRLAYGSAPYPLVLWPAFCSTSRKAGPWPCIDLALLSSSRRELPVKH
jgi:hypothetical protein